MRRGSVADADGVPRTDGAALLQLGGALLRRVQGAFPLSAQEALHVASPHEAFTVELPALAQRNKATNSIIPVHVLGRSRALPFEARTCIRPHIHIPHQTRHMPAARPRTCNSRQTRKE